MHHFSLFFLIAILSHQAFCADFRAEDKSLVKVPAYITKIINTAEAEPVNDGLGKNCDFIGNTFDLQNAGSKSDWIVTTDEACAWAASAAPIWILKKEQAGYEVVLSFITYDLTIGKDSAHGMQHLATGRYTARRSETQLWKFDGKKYVIVKNRFKELP